MLESATRGAETGAYSPTYHSRTPITDGLTKRLEEYEASPGHTGTSAKGMKLWVDEFIGSIEGRGRVPALEVIGNVYTFVCSSIEVEGGELEVDRSNPFEAILAREQPGLFANAKASSTKVYDRCVDQVIEYLERIHADGGYDPTVLVEIQRRLGDVYAVEASGKDPKENDVNFFSSLVNTRKPIKVPGREFPSRRPSASGLVAAVR